MLMTEKFSDRRERLKMVAKHFSFGRSQRYNLIKT